METIPECSAGPVVLIHEHVTGGGFDGESIPSTWLSEGSAMRLALARDFAASGARVAMTLDTRMPAEQGPWTIERIEPGMASEALPALVRRADFTIAIAPETHGTLRDLAASIKRAGGRSLGSSSEAIDLTADKLRLAAHLGRANVPTTGSIRVNLHRGLPRHAAYPAILKPIDGAGCIDTLFVTGPEDPTVSAFPIEVGLLQPYVPGEARSASFLAGRGRPPLLLGVGRQSIAFVDGRLAYRGGTILTEDLPDNHPTRRAVASVPGLSGFVGVDYIVDGVTSEAIVIEINPRATTSCVGLIASLGPGRLAKAWLESATRAESLASSPLGLPSRVISFRADGSLVNVDQSQISESFHPCS